MTRRKRPQVQVMTINGCQLVLYQRGAEAEARELRSALKTIANAREGEMVRVSRRVLDKIGQGWKA